MAQMNLNDTAGPTQTFTRPKKNASKTANAAPTAKAKKAASDKTAKKTTQGYTRETYLGFKIGTDLKDRMKGAIQNIGLQIGITAQTDLVREALDKYLTELEAEYNDGAPFEPILVEKKRRR